MVKKACYFNDYSYVNNRGRIVCFNFMFKKRVKTKVIEFLKKNHQESDIIKFLRENGLELIGYKASKRYKHYDIVEL